MIDVAKIDHLVNHYLIPFGWKVLGAIAVWILGRVLIKATQKVLQKALLRRAVDHTLKTYANSTLGVALNILLLIAVLGVFGIETTSFSAILAAAGVAIGMAWSGLLSNFAAGVFLILFRPFRVGDTINAAGVTGKVYEIGIFATTLDTGDNLRVFVSNNKLFSDNISNYSANRYRIATFKIQFTHGTPLAPVIETLRKKLSHVKGVLLEPEVDGEITEINPVGVTLTIKAACLPSSYADVLQNGYLVIYETLNAEKYPLANSKIEVTLSQN